MNKTEKTALVRNHCNGNDNLDFTKRGILDRETNYLKNI